MVDLAEFVREAWDRGGAVDMSGIGYGRVHWDDKKRIGTTAFPYYRTLAGIAILSGARTALEIGTHWGGSGLSLLRGMILNHGADARLVTIDVSTESDNYLPLQAEAPQIQKIVGDGNSQAVVEAVLDTLQDVDLLYIDALHHAMPTLINFGLYQSLLKPKIAVFDDITLPGTSMPEFWRMMRQAYPDHTINCVDVIEETRGPSPECGFGIWIRPD